jgi:hypothetical protein
MKIRTTVAATCAAIAIAGAGVAHDGGPEHDLCRHPRGEASSQFGTDCD